MEKRIQKAYADINKLNKTLNISITQPYFKLKLKELWLTHEYREKQKEERDHATELRRQKREEEKLLKEAAAAEKEENKYRALLETAQAQAEKATGIDAAEYQARIAELSQQLEQAKGQAERAKSMAEQTRAGHIYVISNVGAFGEGIYKIGMTRRLDPMDRVKELGDASVPFLFDTHAMIYCEDAPSVERGLHAAFDKFRVNRANGRREFFRVSLQDIETEIQKIEPNADIITGIEAQEYHETLAIIAAESGDSQSSSHAFPTDL
jgi:multidrug efflux pump subunit AcrA (membrane-fusion protein)